MIYFQVGESPLHIAVKHCHLEIVEFLLKFLSENFAGSAARQCVNAQDEARSTKHKDLFLIIDRFQAGETSLHFAASIKHAVAHFDEEEVKIMQLLLHSGGNPNLATHETRVINTIFISIDITVAIRKPVCIIARVDRGSF